MPGHNAWWGWEELADLWGGRAGAADYSGNCQLQCLQSGSNRFRVGEEEVTVDFCQAGFCLCVSRLSGMTFARATVEMSHRLILFLIIHLPCLGSLQVCGCSAVRLLMEPAITNTDILTFK